MTENSARCISVGDFNTNCQYIRKHKDYLLGECSLYKDKTHKRTMVAKEKIIKTEADLQKQIKYCETLASLSTCPHISTSFGYTSKAAPQHGDRAESFLDFRQFFDHDLEKEMAFRLRDKDVFDEADIWRITEQLVSAFARMQSLGLSHGQICPRAIFIMKEDDKINAKVHWTNCHQSMYSQVLTGVVPLTAKSYLSPELLESVKRKLRNPNYKPLYSDVFSLGMTILAMCTLGDINEIYNIRDFIVSTQALKARLNWVKTIYSERLYFLLNKMLKIDLNRRSDFKALVDLMAMISRTNDVPLEDPSSPYSKRLGRSSSPGSPRSPNFRSSSAGRKTVTGFEAQKLRSSVASKCSKPGSPVTGRKSAGNRSYLGNTSPSPTPGARALSPKLLSQRTDSTINSIFDKKSSPLLKDGYVTNEVLFGELEKKLLIDPLLGVLKTGMVVKYYSDGSRFEGHMKGKIREKIGINYYANGDVYAGEWRNDKFSGRGVYFFENGERFEGDLKDGHKNGQGVFYYKNRSKYVGEWKNDKKHGKGTFHYFDTKDRYEGDWEEGDRHGEGTFYFATGDVYTGGWHRDDKSGIGLLRYITGAVYEGEWAYNKFNGTGVMVYANGDRYQGTWIEGMKAESGIYEYNDGSRYEGEWDDDHKHGQGALEYSTGDKYIGDWVKGVKHGQGTYYYANGGVYQGEFQNDLKHGSGSMILNDGTNYQGEWVAGERCGKGQLKLANGDFYSGEFKKDSMSGFGVYQWENGDAYEGFWLKNKMHGSGKYFKRTGDHFFGVWDAQRLMRVTTLPDE